MQTKQSSMVHVLINHNFTNRNVILSIMMIEGSCGVLDLSGCRKFKDPCQNIGVVMINFRNLLGKS